MKIKPDSNCKFCHGDGEVFDSVPYGSTNALMPSLCHCVEEQSPEDYNGEIEIVTNILTTQEAFDNLKIALDDSTKAIQNFIKSLLKIDNQ